MTINTDEKEIDKILDRGIIVEVLPSTETFKEKLLSGEKLRFYLGLDATAPALHLGHARNVMLLEDFRKLGHEAILLFGDFTAMIGDPTDKDATRKQLSKEDVLKNTKEWKKQVGPLMGFGDKKNPPKILYNSNWLSKLKFGDVVNLASNFTVQQMIERDMFEKRIKDNKPVYLHEFLYPLMQGYDSVAMDVDVELCGTDQIFNAMVGRTLLKKLNNKEKFVVAGVLMSNPKTKELMSKSLGTGVFIDSTPSDMFGSIMAQPDEMTELLLVNNTRLELDEIKKVLKDKPMDAKKRTALEVVKVFYGEEQAEVARISFENNFQEKKLSNIETEDTVKKGRELKDYLVGSRKVDSNSEFRRLVKDRAIEFDGKIINDIHFKLDRPGVVRVGKKIFVKLVLK